MGESADGGDRPFGDGWSMTYLTITTIHGGDHAGYSSVLANLPTTEPDGLVARYAGQADGAFVITAVWTSKTHWDRFAIESLAPAAKAAAVPGQVSIATLEFDTVDEFAATGRGTE